MEEDLGKRIRLHRQSRGETQEQLAERLGVIRQTVIQWEKGEVPASFAKLIQEMAEADKAAEKTYQLKLPFDQPMDLEVRVSPKKPASIRLEVEWKQKAG